MLALFLLFMIQLTYLTFNSIDTYHKYLDTRQSITAEGIYIGSSKQKKEDHILIDLNGEVRTFIAPAALNLHSLQWNDRVAIQYGERTMMIGSLENITFTAPTLIPIPVDSSNTDTTDIQQ
ncbi:hypothetical protein [Heliorestis convoluta]|uniref:Uncharacterized protein n=1 Tax=Heliorestis convoluta TaxID=356322 RepID=A0A5Q2MZM3_9FIRM|nr:hypothetical protein [Heliorestis convoluta]QGG46929.1 hypothetical protein FTV88_0751 [Heliorestis convoluta]